MNLTQIKIRKTFTEGNLKATVSVVLYDCLAVHDIKVIESNNRLFVAMPSRKYSDGMYRDIIYPMTADLRDELEDTILEAYEKYVALQAVMEAEN